MTTPPALARPRRRPRRWWRRGARLAFSVLVAGLAAEGLVLLVAGEQPKCPRHVLEAPWGLRRNEPGSRYTHSSRDGCWEFRINAQGMRADQDVPYQKPEGRLRVLSLGDSFTIGYEVDLPQCFSLVLEQRLRDRGLPVDVLNFGMSGSSPAEQLLGYEREWKRYQPDLVLVSFFANDLADNVRSGLFRVEGDRLVQGAERYVPGGALGNFLNTDPVFNWLSENSNAFVLLKQKATLWLKGESHADNVKRAVELKASQQGAPAGTGGAVSHDQRLCALIYQRLLADLSARDVPLVIQSIPSQIGGGDGALLDWFPYDAMEDLAQRENLSLLPMKPLLDPYLGEQLLYHQHTFFHWTPWAHRLSGEALATLILDEGLLP